MRPSFIAKMHSIFALTVFLAVGIVSSGCDRKPKPAATEKIVVTSPPFALTGLLLLAIDQGFFAQQGLEVAVDFKASGKQSLDFMLEQKSQIALSAETPVMNAIMSGKRLAILGALGESFGDFMIVGRKDLGIVKPEDLLGKRIAVEPGTSSEYFLDAVLTDHNIGRNKVNIVPTSTDKIEMALVTGEVDAGVGWQPYVLAWQKQLGEKAFSYANPRYYTLTWFITATPDFVASHDEALKKFFRALSTAETYHQTQPNEMRRVLAEQAKISAELYDTNVYRFGLRLDQSMLVILEGLSQWAMQRGIVPQQTMPNYLDFFNTTPLKAVKPEAVTIVR